MKKLFLIIVLVTQIFSQADWLPGTANTLPKGRWEYGLFQPIRRGLSGDREISFYKLTAILMPGATIKQQWRQRYQWTLSTTHSLYYPTPLLTMLAKEGIGGMISPEFDIPKMVSFWNMALASKQLDKNRILTFKAGGAVAFGGEDLTEGSTIDLPLIYHRLAVYYNGWLMRFGVDINGRMSRKWTYLVDGDLFLIPGMKGSLALEHKSMITWEKSARFHLSLGYKFIFGEYPDGYPKDKTTRIHILPLIDFIWSKN